MALTVEKVMNMARLPLVLLMRYIERDIAARMDIVYFPPLMRCGKMLRVSLYRRRHWRKRQIGGSAPRKPRRREWFELHWTGLSHALA